MTLKTLLIVFLALASSLVVTEHRALAARNGSIGLSGGLGGYGANGWPLSNYGATVAFKGDRNGEFALGYTVNQINANSAYPFNGNVILQQYEIDLRRRFAERFGLYLGIPVNYFSSSNELIIPSGVTLGAQVGYDFGFAGRFSVGLHLQDTFIRNFFVGMVTFKIWAANK